jgi:hypothetical protein
MTDVFGMTDMLGMRDVRGKGERDADTDCR